MKNLWITFMLALSLVGCANTTDPSTYSVGSVGQVNRSVPGVIISSRVVTINANTGTAGAVGGVAGAVAGSSIGSGSRANALGAIGGAVAGAMIGAALEHGRSQYQGMEYVVSTANGNLLTITQGYDPQFQENEKVIILYGSPARIIKDPRP